MVVNIVLEEERRGEPSFATSDTLSGRSPDLIESVLCNVLDV